MDRDRVIEILEEIGTLLELKGENPFKTRAYYSAARVLESVNEPLARMVAEERLGTLKGVGTALQQKISQLVTTGELPYHRELRASIAPDLLDMLTIPGLGPKKIKALHDALQVTTLEGLEAACQEGRVAGLKGFGEKTQGKILEGIAFRRDHQSQHLLFDAWRVAEPILELLRGHPDVLRCSLAGSLRRRKETVGDIDFVVSSRAGEEVLEFFTSQPGVESILAKGNTKASVLLKGGLQADLRVVRDDQYPFALAYFTGSKEHNIVMRQRAIERGLRLNEYGLFPAGKEGPGDSVVCQSEDELFQALDFAYVPPELREDRGEFEHAAVAELPRLLEWTELKGSLHNHSDWSDGRQSLEEIVAHAEELGCDYWAVTDHSRSSFVANGLDEKRLRRQLQAVAEVNQGCAGRGSAFRLLTGSEVDILADGGLDFPDELLAELDVVVASIHQGFSGDEEVMTRRLIRAAENRMVHMLGHLTGRLLLQRRPYPLNQQAVIDACAANGTWIELNASPQRLDLDWRLWAYARSKGVLCVINCDAHRAEHADFLRLGGEVARKGGLGCADVVNTRSLEDLRKLLQCKRSQR